MSFLKLNLKPYYDSGEDDILNDFYIPTLEQSVEYCRLAGFFSSTSLAVSSRGIKGLLKNNGKMRLVAGAILQKEDIEAIKKGIETPSEIIEKFALKDLDELENEFVKNHVEALGWLVANGKLEIKIAIIKDEEGNYLDANSILYKGIFHQKVGILTDKDGKMISFSGSVNETAKAWTENVEEFKVFRSWIEAEYEHFKSDYDKFDKYWNNQSKRAEIIEVPTAIKEKLIQIAPDNLEKLNLNWQPIEKKIQLRDYQLQAIKNWNEHGRRGFFEMATGTGKTWTALGCVKEILDSGEKLVVVITCPFTHLVEQWLKKDIEKFELKGITAYGSYNSWKDEVANEILDFNNGYSKYLIILTTHDTFYSDNFIKMILKIDGNILLIGDESHGLGSEERRNGLLEIYKYRIGLSATPTRWFDDEGTDILKNFFGETVFEFPLKDAIKEGFLAEYEYYPHFVSLDAEESEQYLKETKKISREYFKTKDKKEQSKKFEFLCIKRQKIVVNATAKFKVFEDILDSMSNISKCLVYCSDKQIDKAQDILNRKSIINHRFTAEENTEERKKILKLFSEGKYQSLVAMKCLDEGVDVPSTQTAIILASSGNPREYIQRRGRILRKSEGKENAIIHDILVIPNVNPKYEPELFELERKILKKELGRYEEFSKTARNKAHALNLIIPYMLKFKAYTEEGG